MSKAIKELVERRSKLEKDIQEAISKLTSEFIQETSIYVLGVNVEIINVSTVAASDFIVGSCFVKLRI